MPSQLIPWFATCHSSQAPVQKLIWTMLWQQTVFESRDLVPSNYVLKLLWLSHWSQFSPPWKWRARPEASRVPRGASCVSWYNWTSTFARCPKRSKILGRVLSCFQLDFGFALTQSCHLQQRTSVCVPIIAASSEICELHFNLLRSFYVLEWLCYTYVMSMLAWLWEVVLMINF